MEDIDVLRPKRKFNEICHGSPSAIEARLSKFIRESSPVARDAGNLCGSCAAMDLDHIFQTQVERDIGEFIKDLRASVSELASSDCPL
jgi:hypothetical protein